MIFDMFLCLIVTFYNWMWTVLIC